MEHDEVEKILFDRIRRLEPEPIVKKIFGFLYFQSVSNQEMIRLALGPDSLIHKLIHTAKTARILEPVVAGFQLTTDLDSSIAPFNYYPYEEFSNMGLLDKTWQFSYHSSNGYYNEMSLRKLEFEIEELLKCRRGPVSIASLPMLYYEKYGKSLQAEGYLTESERHGKVGYNLTKLLARLNNSIRLIDRPHGQHVVMLAQDVNNGSSLDSASRQIYLTFPADSTFVEEDIVAYFSVFGLVQDVRIPCQQRRMFGFVTFTNAETVNIVLSKGNPHYVCGARVLVKPYKEKPKFVERKHKEKLGYHWHTYGKPMTFTSTSKFMPIESGHHLIDIVTSSSTTDYDESIFSNSDDPDNESFQGVKLPKTLLIRHLTRRWQELDAPRMHRMCLVKM